MSCSNVRKKPLKALLYDFLCEKSVKKRMQKSIYVWYFTEKIHKALELKANIIL